MLNHVSAYTTGVHTETPSQDLRVMSLLRDMVQTITFGFGPLGLGFHDLLLLLLSSVFCYQSLHTQQHSSISNTVSCAQGFHHMVCHQYVQCADQNPLMVPPMPHASA